MVAEGLGATVLPDFSVAGDPLERIGLITYRPLAVHATGVHVMLRRRRTESVPRSARDLHDTFRMPGPGPGPNPDRGHRGTRLTVLGPRMQSPEGPDKGHVVRIDDRWPGGAGAHPDGVRVWKGSIEGTRHMSPPSRREARSDAG
ncbi:hypothetical protein [Streptomyces sp. NPDC017958]|uniref:hypothetical protein n=1 Tax=Streptomyces sp. NPDC017958 TaxID=3365021 RepID=UPI003788DC59